MSRVYEESPELICVPVDVYQELIEAADSWLNELYEIADSVYTDEEEASYLTKTDQVTDLIAYARSLLDDTE